MFVAVKILKALKESEESANRSETPCMKGPEDKRHWAVSQWTVPHHTHMKIRDTGLCSSGWSHTMHT